MTFLMLALIAQLSNPTYIRPDADIEHRTVAVEYVYDGDTFKGADGISYRLAGINAPEVAHPEHGKPTGEPGGEEAADALRSLIANQHVMAIIDRAHPTDRYGRTVAIVMHGDKDVNIEMIRNGFAELRYVDLSPMIDAPLFRRAAEMPSAPPRSDQSASDTTLGFGISDRRAWDLGFPRSGHVLAPGDKIRIVVGNQTQDFSINPDGEILIRGLGVFRVSDKTSATATTDLDSAIRAKGIAASPITVFYLAPPAKIQRNVVILGAVNKSGTYPATTLLSVISLADGFTYAANPTEVRITSGDSTTIINAARIMAGVDRDIELQGGEVIVVPTLPRILVSGAVAKPNWVTALFLSEAISAAGGPTQEADFEHVEFRSGNETSSRVNVQAIFSGKSDDIRLNDRDRITIPTRPRAIASTVQVYGSVQRPGTQQGFTVADAVRQSSPDSSADLAHVIIDRSYGESETVNARDIALGHELDQNLREGDRILIPRRIDMPTSPTDTPQLVTLLGDVAKPGSYPTGTLTQVLAFAGGVTNTARTSAIRVRFPDSRSATYDLAKVTSGRQPDPLLPANATVYVESDEPRRQSMNDLRTFIGIFSTLALLALKVGG